jgi:hypothetical protein
MTHTSVVDRTRRPSSSLAVGVIALVLGVGALVAGAPLVTLASGGWPWTTTVSEETEPPSATARIVEDDGTVHQFAGTPPATRAWVADREDQLKESYGIPLKVAVGRALSGVGAALLVLGCAVLLRHLWYRRRSTLRAGTARPA